MAAPTDVRVESDTPTSTILRWIYAGASTLGVYRSTDGSSYSLITSPLLAADVDVYDDTTVSEQTRYWYKLSDDGGSTFSSVVAVVTQVNPNKVVNKVPLSLGDATDLEDLKTQLAAREERLSPIDPCVVCPENGSLVFDCSFGCIKFEAVATEDINSISIVGCPPLECPDIHIIVPPDETREICGWPTACGHEGDECFEAPIAGGEEGRTLDQNGFVYNGYGRKLRSGPGSCPCRPPRGLNSLTLVCCSEDCTIDCEDNPAVSLRACGGVGPYNWTWTGDIEVFPTVGPSVSARFPEEYRNDDPAFGTAFIQIGARYTIGVGGNCATGGQEFASIGSAKRSLRTACDGTQSQAVGWSGTDDGTITYSSTNGDCPDNGQPFMAGLQATITNPHSSQVHDVSAGTLVSIFNDEMIDIRTAEQIQQGCNPIPCMEADTAATVTVTDSVGQSVTRVLGV